MAVRVGGKGRGRGLGRLKEGSLGERLGRRERGGGAGRTKGSYRKNIERSLERKCD